MNKYQVIDAKMVLHIADYVLPWAIVSYYVPKRRS